MKLIRLIMPFFLLALLAVAVPAGFASDEEETEDTSVSETGTMNCPAKTKTRCYVAVGSTAIGSIQRYKDYRKIDRDWFRVELIEDHTYSIDLRGSASGRGTLTDPSIHNIYDSLGKRIASTKGSDQENNFDDFLVYTASATGSHYISAASRENSGRVASRWGSYELEVHDTAVEREEETAEDDHPSDTSASTLLPLGGDPFAATIELKDDEDWFKVYLNEDQEYDFHAKGASSDKGTLVDPQIVGIYTSSGDKVEDSEGENNDIDQLDDKAVVEVDDSGNYFLAVKGYVSSTGTYEVSYEEHVESEKSSGCENKAGWTEDCNPVHVPYSALAKCRVNSTFNNATIAKSGDRVDCLGYRHYDETAFRYYLSLNRSSHAPTLATPTGLKNTSGATRHLHGIARWGTETQYFKIMLEAGTEYRFRAHHPAKDVGDGFRYSDSHPEGNDLNSKETLEKYRFRDPRFVEGDNPNSTQVEEWHLDEEHWDRYPVENPTDMRSVNTWTDPATGLYDPLGNAAHLYRVYLDALAVDGVEWHEVNCKTQVHCRNNSHYRASGTETTFTPTVSGPYYIEVEASPGGITQGVPQSIYELEISLTSVD